LVYGPGIDQVALEFGDVFWSVLGIKACKLGRAKAGQPVTVYHADPTGRWGSTYGVVSGPVDGEPLLLTHTATTYRGSSGAPVFGAQNVVVGMHVQGDPLNQANHMMVNAILRMALGPQNEPELESAPADIHGDDFTVVTADMFHDPAIHSPAGHSPFVVKGALYSVPPNESRGSGRSTRLLDYGRLNSSWVDIIDNHYGSRDEAKLFGIPILKRSVAEALKAKVAWEEPPNYLERTKALGLDPAKQYSDHFLTMAEEGNRISSANKQPIRESGLPGQAPLPSGFRATALDGTLALQNPSPQTRDSPGPRAHSSSSKGSPMQQPSLPRTRSQNRKRSPKQAQDSLQLASLPQSGKESGQQQRRRTSSPLKQ